MRIWKYQLKDYESLVEIPKGGKVLKIGVQKGIPCIWVLVNQNAEKEKRFFRGYSTGEELPKVQKRTYIGTFELERLVFHLFEEVL